MVSSDNAEKKEKILVSLWPGLGDIMFATPALRALRHKFPEADITALSLWGKAGRPLLANNPYVDRLIFADPGDFFPPSACYAFWKKLKSERFDLGIQLSFPIHWLFYLLRIKKRVSFGNGPFWWLIPCLDRRDRDTHVAEHFAKAIDRIDGVRYRDDKGYDLRLSEDDLGLAERTLSELEHSSGPIVVAHSGARCNKNKRWGVEKLVALMNKLHRQFSVRFILVGGKDDSHMSQSIAKQTEARTLDLAAKLSLTETAAVVSRCDLYIGNDAGPTHIAAATGTPIVAIFGSSNPSAFRPLTDKAIVITPEMECAPCFHPVGHMWLLWGLRLRYYNQCRAMDSISVDDVFRACESFLEK